VNAEPQYTRAQARSANHTDNRGHDVRSTNQSHQSLANPAYEMGISPPSRPHRQTVPSQKPEGGLNFGSEAVIFHRKYQQTTFADDNEIAGEELSRAHQTRGRSVPPTKQEIFNSAPIQATFLEDALREEMSQRVSHRSSYQRLLNSSATRSHAGPPSERELFIREKFLFLKERAMFLRERQIFMIEKEQFLMEKQELLRRRSDISPRETSQSMDKVSARTSSQVKRAASCGGLLAASQSCISSPPRCEGSTTTCAADRHASDRPGLPARNPALHPLSAARTAGKRTADGRSGGSRPSAAPRWTAGRRLRGAGQRRR
jgi:hypothetical protein